MPQESSWTDDDISELRILWDAGHSAAEIGRRTGRTKNAICGKANRLELPERQSPIRNRDPNMPLPKRARDGVPLVQGPTLPPLSSTSAAPIVHRTPTAQPRQPATPLESKISSVLRSQIGLHNYRARHDVTSGVKPDPVPIERVRAIASPLPSRVPECCWPLNEGPPWEFCCAPAVPGRSYCAVHTKEAYVRVRDRREDATLAGEP